MLIDMLSSDMYAQFNIVLANRIGLHAAIYVAEILNLYRRAIVKQSFVDEKYVKIDRTYIEKRTTFNKEEQESLDELLCSLNILKLDPYSKQHNVVYIDADAITGIMLDDRKTVVSKVKNFSVQKEKKPTKKSLTAIALKELIETTNDELREAYSEWIDAVLDKNGWMAKASVTEGQKLVDSYTNRDLDIALQIVRIGAMNGYKDMQWAVENYEKKCKSKKFDSSHLDYSQPIKKPTRIEFSNDVY